MYNDKIVQVVDCISDLVVVVEVPSCVLVEEEMEQPKG